MATYKSRFSNARVGAAGTTGTPAIEIMNQSATEAFIKRIECCLIAATAVQIGLGRPAAAGITPTAPVALLPDNGVDTTLVKTAVAWGTAPTQPTTYYRMGEAPAVIGTTLVFTFEGLGLRLAPGQTFVIWNRNTNSQLDITVTVDQNVIGVVNS
jgi:hypothetical protein